MEHPKSIAIGSDHAGFERKEALKKHLLDEGYKVLDCGTYSEESVDYPDYAHPVARMVASGEAALGIVICGSGNGVCMSVNKHPGIRGALAWREDIARLAREHNNANILCLPGRFVSDEEAAKIADAWLNAEFEGGRHERRVKKIPCC